MNKAIKSPFHSNAGGTQKTAFSKSSISGHTTFLSTESLPICDTWNAGLAVATGSTKSGQPNNIAKPVRGWVSVVSRCHTRTIHYSPGTKSICAMADTIMAPAFSFSSQSSFYFSSDHSAKWFR